MNINIYKPSLLIILISVLILSLSMDGLYAQNNSTKKNSERLIGTWVLDFNKSINQIKSESRVYYDSLKIEKKNFIKDAFSSRKVTFQKGGGYILEIKPGTQLSGTWELQEDQVTLRIKMDNGKEYQHQIENISSSTLFLDLGGDKSKNRLFRKWHLKKLTN